jgi:hypothetical protein
MVRLQPEDMKSGGIVKLLVHALKGIQDLNTCTRSKFKSKIARVYACVLTSLRTLFKRTADLAATSALTREISPSSVADVLAGKASYRLDSHHVI